MLRLLLLLPAVLAAADVWQVRLEEPTGLYRRDGEVVRVPLAKVGDHRAGYVVTAPSGRETPSQVAGEDLLFRADVVPGQVPVYTVSCCSGEPRRYANDIDVRKFGMRRLEIGNTRFRVVIDTGVGAIVEAYSLTAAPQRMLNLVETTLEHPDTLKDDLHSASRRPMPAVPGVEGENTGWTSLGGSGGFSKVDIVDAGPLQGRVRLHRLGEVQELTWTATGAWLKWTAQTGFRFAAISASPYLPFDRYLDTPESVLWPDVSSREEPDDHAIGPRDYRKFRGGHGVYYQLAANYGALGIVALDAEIEWTGLGSRRFIGRKSGGVASVGITFPKWAGFRTLLEARREQRMLREPLLVRVGSGVRAGAVPPHDEWELAWAEKGAERPSSEWRVVKVPGTVHVQWLGPKAMTREAEWISSKEWWYRKKLRVPREYVGKRLRLQFEATDYFAETFIDGVFVGRHEGYIDPYEYDVTKYCKPGAEHELFVRVWTPVHYYWRSRPYTIKGSYGAVDQKPDDITALGITRPVRLIASGPTFIRDVAVATRLNDDGSAEVEIESELDGPAEGHRWQATLTPRNFDSGDQHRAEGAADSKLRITVARPQLWWTWDHGKPNLYTLDLRLTGPDGKVADTRSLTVGIREIEKIGWQFYLNRKRMFIRGTNYYYNLFLSDMDKTKYARDLELMLRMNVNMIRLHCHFTNREFYDLADERGVLLWQDFLEAWYPEDTAFSVRAAALYDNHIRYVRNHPSIALWATSDEESLENYRDLTKHLAPRAAMLDPQRRPVVRSTGRYGDSHVYYGWYGGSIWQYGKMNDVFVSELGATSLPNYETLIKFLPNHWPIKDHEDEWRWRKLQIPEAMKAWGDPGNMTLREYIPKTQAYTARLFQIALERVRRLKSQGTGGILHFHAIDIWPSITMAAIDVDRVPTKTFYTVQRSFEPVLASIEYDRDRWARGETVRVGIWAINDRWTALPGARIEWRIVDARGAVQASGTVAAPMEADSSRKVNDVEWAASEPGGYELRAAVVAGDGSRVSENVFEFEVTGGGSAKPPSK